MTERRLVTLLAGVAVLAVAGGLIWWFILRSVEPDESVGRPGDGRRSIPVETVTVSRSTVRDVARFSGTLESIASFTVAPRVAGRLNRLRVDIGDTVTNGQLIAEIDDEEYAQQLQQARAELNVAESNLAESISALEIAERDLERTLALHGRGVVSDTERDAAQSRYDAASARRRVAEAQRDQREAAMAAARIRMAYTRIHARWENPDGDRVVGERHVHEGALLSVGQPIVSILDIDRLVAVVYVVERDYPNLAVGQTARIMADALPNAEFTGRVVRVAPLISERSRQARVEIEIENPDRVLRPGMFVRSEIVVSITEDACVLPLNALVRSDGQTGVFQVVPDALTVRFVPLTTGVSDRDIVQVLEPRLDGQVVTMGRHLLSDGSEIRIIE